MNVYNVIIGFLFNCILSYYITKSEGKALRGL